MKRDYVLVLAITAGLTAAAFVARWNDGHRPDVPAQFAEEQLYLNGPTMKRITLAFNGIAADWYWMRSLQYVGRKIINYEDTHSGKLRLSDLKSLDLRLLPALLRTATTLDPKFLDAYYYGAVILPDVDENEAIALLNQGIAANPEQWKLSQHLGYIYWQHREYQKASEVYETGGKLPDAPPWMLAMSARMKAEGGASQAAREMYVHLYEASDDLNVKGMVEKQLMRLDSLDERAHESGGGASQAAREMYVHLYEASDDLNVKGMVEKQLMRLDSLDERAKIRVVLSDYAKSTGHCAASWKEVAAALRAMRVRLDASGAPMDPSNTAYRLITGGCEVDVDDNSPVPR